MQARLVDSAKRKVNKKIRDEKIDKIIFHCSATVEGQNISVATIRNWHVKGRGWSDIGYHYYIGIDGKINSCRPVNKIGAHTKARMKVALAYAIVED